MNLAIVFGPNLLRPKTDTVRRLIEDALYVNGVIRSLLDEFEFLVTVRPFFFPFLLPLVFIKSPYFKCTAQQPHKQENQIVITPAPRLEISYVVRTLFPFPFLPPSSFLPSNQLNHCIQDSQNEKTQPSGASKRRFSCFNLIYYF